MGFSLKTFGSAKALRDCAGRALGGVALLVVMSISPATTAAQGKDDLWEVTTKIEMPGMPMAMPPQTVRQCRAKGGKDDAYIPQQQNCRVVDQQRAGNRITFKMVCSGTDAMEATGEVTVGAESYDGRMKMVMRREGQSMEMASTFTGKRVGACTAPAN